jgi:hypothetical protein
VGFGESSTVMLLFPVDSSKLRRCDGVLPPLSGVDESGWKDRPVLATGNPCGLCVDQECLNLGPEDINARVAEMHKMTVAFDS